MRLIDADALIERIGDWIPHDKCGEEDIKDVVYAEACIDLIDVINDAPTVEQNGWIPCSERLPEEDGEYLVESTRGYEVFYYREEEKQFGLMVLSFDGKVRFVPKKVCEWMPIPGVEE